MAACPVGDIANFYTLLARANLALSVTLNALTLLIAPASMALVFETYDRVIGVPFEFALPTPAILLRLTLMLALPLLAGMAVRRVRPESAALYGRSLRRIVAVGIVYLITTTIATQYDQLAEEWQQTAAAGAVFIVVALAVGLVLARLLRLSKDDSVTIGIGFSVRNVALALAIAVTLLEPHRLCRFRGGLFYNRGAPAAGCGRRLSEIAGASCSAGLAHPDCL